MATDLTTSTPIQEINIGYDAARNKLYSIFWTTDESPPREGAVGLTNGPPPEGHYQLDSYNILKQIYNSPNGFRNAANEAVPITLAGFDDPSWTIDDLENNLLWHPFRIGSWEGYQANLRIQGAATRGVVKHEGTGDEERIEQTIGHVVVPRQASGTTKSVSLERWNVVRLTSTRINFTLAIDTDDNINSISKLDALTPIKAFLAYLESVRSGGSEIGDEILTSSTYTGRQFHIRQQSSDYRRY